MTLHIGTKLVHLTPMTRKEYNDYRKWELPEDENGADEGYLVEYTDGGKPNHPDHEGYISWSPKEQADRAHRPTDGMSFGLAIEAAKKGFKICRKGWNGKGMWVIYNPGSKGETHAMFEGSVYKNHGVDNCEILPHFDMWTVNATGCRAMLPGWVASQTDIDADDWMIFQEQSESCYISRMKTELEELMARASKLNEQIGSKGFEEYGVVYRCLTKQQFEVMEQYINHLKQRHIMECLADAEKGVQAEQ